MLSCFSHVQFFVTLWTVAHQAPLSMGFSRHEHWTRLPCPLPGDLPDPGIKPTSPGSPALAGGFFATSATWEACLPSLLLIIQGLEQMSLFRETLLTWSISLIPSTLCIPLLFCLYHLSLPEILLRCPTKMWTLWKQRLCLIHLILLVPEIVPGTK